MPFEPETRFGRYVIERLLGEGGMGTVYAAHDATLGRRVAIKVLRAQGHDAVELRERLLREARAGAAISHPNATIVHEVGEHEGQPYIAMEYLEGRTLRSYVGGAETDVETRVRWLIDVARVLAVAHAAGLVHRDIKPDNVMITRDGVVKVLDFGIARAAIAVVDPNAATMTPDRAPTHLAPITAQGVMIGTPLYMAPEQMLGGLVDGRTDQFAWAVMAFELLSGRVPWPVGSDASGGARLVAAIVSDQPAPALVADGVPPEVRAVVARALSKEPGKRFGTMREIVEALAPDTAIGKRGVVTEAFAPRQRRSIALPSAIALAAIGALIFGGMRMRAARRAEAVSSAASVATGSSSMATSASGAASSSATSVVTTLGDLPPPSTKVPEAASEYAAGMQAFRDNNWFRAQEHFERVTKLDPSMGAGYFRLAISLVPTSPEKKRAAFARAITLRMQLTERDRALLDALEAVLQRAQEEPAEAVRRIEKMIERYPNDVELYDWMGMLQQGAPASLGPSEKATLLDDKDGNAWQMKADALVTLGRIDEARQAYDRCAAIAVDGADCVAWSSTIDILEGRCEDFERKARTAADRAPPYAMLQLWAAVALRRPEANVRALLSAIVAMQTEGEGPLSATFGETVLAIVAGDFVHARASLAQETSLLAANPAARSEYQWSYALAMQAVGIALETGDVEGARTAARALTQRSPSLSHSDSVGHGVDLSLYLARLATPDADGPAFEEVRQSWIETRRKGGAYPGLLWTYGYAAAALTPREAEQALAALPKFTPLTPFMSAAAMLAFDVGLPDEEIGRTYLLAGRTDEAIPYLRRASRNCSVFGSPFAVTHASLNLGKALEQKGDKAGACAAYADVLARWGKATPRSVSAEDARKRTSALACDPHAP